MSFSPRQYLGALVLDWPGFEMRLRRDWIAIRNRRQKLIRAPDGSGVQCDWQWTSDLHISRAFPRLGARLMRRALQDWPIGFAETPPITSGAVQVSFVIGHRGTARLPHLLATLATIAAQLEVSLDCTVVEQSVEPEIRGHLPQWVRYIHTRLPSADMPYCRAWAFNVGARHAKGALLILHDNDLLIPEAYAAESWRRFRAGHDLVNLKRFLFFLNKQHSRRVREEMTVPLNEPVNTVMQNAQGGGSISMRRDAFLAIGGFDESFVGWGGEDNEFWERAQTLQVWPFGYMPLVHLWHPAQPGKAHGDNPTLNLYRERSRAPVEERIRELRDRDFGNPERLSVAATGINTVT